MGLFFFYVRDVVEFASVKLGWLQLDTEWTDFLGLAAVVGLGNTHHQVGSFSGLGLQRFTGGFLLVRQGLRTLVLPFWLAEV